MHTADGKPSHSKSDANERNEDMPTGPSTRTNGKTKNQKTSAQKLKVIQQDMICSALFHIVLDTSAPASARAAAARTLLDELNRRGNAGDRPLSALSIEELEAELKPGEKPG